MSYDTKATTFVFTHEKLTPIVGKPNHESVKLLRQELYANAFENECTLGGGNHGYLGLIMPDEAYLQLQIDSGIEAPVAFIKPAAPADNATDVIKASINKKILDYKSMEAHLKKQLIDAVERDYIELMSDDFIGFGKYSCKAVLEYIVTKYAGITYAETQANRDSLDAEWDPSEPIHRLWIRIQKVQRFAKAGGKDIDDDTAMQAILDVLKKTGVFMTHVTIWKQKPENTWTMKQFQEFFDAADKERNEHTTKEAGYVNAAKAATNPNTASANAATSNTDSTNDKSYMVFGDKKIYYCWSHGGNTNANHTSLTCNRPKQGHVNTSTWDNTCGGCTDMNISAQNQRFRFRNNNDGNNNNRINRNNNGNSGNRNNNGNNGNNNNNRNSNNNNGNNNNGNSNNGNNNNWNNNNWNNNNGNSNNGNNSNGHNNSGNNNNGSNNSNGTNNSGGN
jgi:hypothetical protein